MTETFNFDSLAELFAAAIAPALPNHLLYKPHEKQVKFHESEANGRLLLGGNRSGKTVAGCNEGIDWCLGTHPNFELPKPPIYGRIVTVDFTSGAAKIIIPQLKQWLPKSALINESWDDSYNAKEHLLTFENGSTIDIMSHDQDLDKFAGINLHWVWFDEEPPFNIFKECKTRLADYNGRWWMTMTPVEGITWTFDELFEKQDSKLIEVIQVDQDENPYLSEEGRKNLQEGLSEDEIKIRKQGKYIAVSGLVFKNYDPEKHVIKSTIPNSTAWVHYRSLDHGFSNPTAVYWHAVHKKTGQVVTYREHYKSEWTIEQHADFLVADERVLREKYGIVPFISIADPAIKQRQAVTGLSVQIMYAQKGINLALGAVRDVKAGLDKMIEYQRQVKWLITEDCPMLQREMRKYRRADYSTQKLKDRNNKREEPQKKDDHGIDSCRYFFSFMPELNPLSPPSPEPRGSLEGLEGVDVRVQPERGIRYDTSLFNTNREPEFVEDTSGDW